MQNIRDALPLSGIGIQLHSLYASGLYRLSFKAITTLLFSVSVCLCFLTRKDIPDQCSPSPCNARGTVRCEDKKGDFLCHCFTGWTGARCEKGTVVTVERERGYIVVLELSRRLNFLHRHSDVMSGICEKMSESL